MEFKKTTIYLDESRIEKCKKIESYWTKSMDEYDPGFKHRISTSALLQRCIDVTYNLYFGVENDLPFS